MKNTEFTDLFKALRERANLSYRALANSIGFSVAYIFDLENGNREPTEKIVEILIKFYNLNLEQQRILYDAVANSTNNLPFDVINYLKAHPEELDRVIYEMQENKIQNL